MSGPELPERCPFEDEVLLLGDGELEFTRRFVVEAHLGLCDSCAELEETVTDIDELVAALPCAPLGAAERALARLPDTRPRLRPFALAAAASLLVFVGLRGSLDGRTPGGPATGSNAMVAGHQAPESRTPVDPEHAALAETSHAAPLPALPPPLPPAGPTLRRRLAAYEPGAGGSEVRALEIAAEIRRQGPRSARALAGVLDEGGELLPAALDVAAHVHAPPVTAALGRRVDHPLYGDVAARALAAGHDRGAVTSLIGHLEGPGAAAARDALAEIGGREAARALVERFWTVDPDARGAYLDAAVRADAAVGGAACLEALGTPRDEAEPNGHVGTAARQIVRRRAELLLPYLRRTARGRDALRARLAVRALGWAGDGASRPLMAELARAPRTAAAATSALLDLGTPRALADACAAVRLGGADGAAARAFAGRAIAEMHLLERAVRGDAAERRLALGLLARCGGAAAAEALGTTDFPRALQDDVVSTLASIGGAEAAEALAPLATVPGLETGVITALGATGSPRAVPLLVDIGERSPRRRAQVASALARIDHPASVDALVGLLRDDRAAATALDALAGMPARRVVPPLLEHCGESVPLPVRRALARIAGRDLGSSPTPWREWWAARI